MLAIKLDKEIPCEYLCHYIQQLINTHMKDISSDLTNAVLVVEVKTIIDETDRTLYLTDNRTSGEQ